MRISALLFWTLAAFVARELPRTAAAASDTPTDNPQNDDVNEVHSESNSVTVDQSPTAMAIAPPDRLELPLSVAGEPIGGFNNDQFTVEPENSEVSDLNRLEASMSEASMSNIPMHHGRQLFFDNHQFSVEDATTLTRIDRPATTGLNSPQQSPSEPEEAIAPLPLRNVLSPEPIISPNSITPPRASIMTKALRSNPPSIDTLSAGSPEWTSMDEGAPTVPSLNPAMTDHRSIPAKAEDEQEELISTTSQGSTVLLSQIETVAPPIYINAPVEQDSLEEFNGDIPRPPRRGRASPALTIANPSGFGAHDNTVFVGASYQSHTRFANSDEDDGTMLVGVGLGNAQENVGVQLSYTLASFGGSRDFGAGGFNAKVHRQLPGGWGMALGWEGFLTTGDTDFEDTVYGSVTHLIRSREHIDQPFSRVAITAGAGTGRFRSEDAVDDDRSEVGVFSSLAVRVVESVGAVVEWTGQDLTAGLSIAPFKEVPIVFTPALRDITGAGDGARFVFGTGVVFKF